MRLMRCLLVLVVTFVLLTKPAVTEAVDSGKLIEKDGQHVFVESQDPAVKLLLERSLNKGSLRRMNMTGFSRNRKHMPI